MRLVLVAATAAFALTGCAASSKLFYADRAKPDPTALCRVALDDTAEAGYRADVIAELTKRGISENDCRSKVSTQNAVIVTSAVVGLTAAALIACSNGRCPSGGSGAPTYSVYSPGGPDWDCEGGLGDGPLYFRGPAALAADYYDLDRDHDGIACEPFDDRGA